MASAYDNPTMFFVAAASGARQARATDFILVDLVGVYGEARAGLGPEREREEAEDVDLRGVDVCVGRRYEAASQDMGSWGNGEQKLMPVHPTTPG